MLRLLRIIATSAIATISAIGLMVGGVIVFHDWQHRDDEEWN